MLSVAETNRGNFLCSCARKSKPQTNRKSDTDVYGDECRAEIAQAAYFTLEPMMSGDVCVHVEARQARGSSAGGFHERHDCDTYTVCVIMQSVCRSAKE